MNPSRRTPPAPQVILAPRDVPDLDYRTMPGAGDKRFFSCTPLRATMSQQGCAARWREAQATAVAAGDRFAACRGCAIGAAHAGRDMVRYSSHFGAMICPRCRKFAGRMIGGTRCVSCANRDYELAKGRNARGNVPVKLLAERALHHVRYKLIVNGVPVLKSAPAAVDLFETVFQTLRTTKGELAFGFAGPAHLLRQGRLFP